MSGADRHTDPPPVTGRSGRRPGEDVAVGPARRCRICRTVRAAAALAAVAVAVWAVGLAWFAGRAGEIEPAPDDLTTDAIVVLTGGSNRMAEGFRLMTRDIAGTLFVSGVYEGVEVADLLAVTDGELGDLSCCVVLGHAATDTRGNAVETAAWMRAQGYGSLRLVTSNYHMVRSLLEFRRALPDVEILPHPVETERVRVEAWWASPGTALLLATEWNKYLLSLALGRPERLQHLSETARETESLSRSTPGSVAGTS